MRFFGIERRVSKDYIESMEGFEIDDTMYGTSAEIERNKRASDNANNLRQIACDE